MVLFAGLFPMITLAGYATAGFIVTVTVGVEAEIGVLLTPTACMLYVPAAVNV